MNYRILFLLAGGLLIFSCGVKDKSSNASSSALFTLMDGPAIGIDFANNLTFDKDFNIYTYRNFYNGGGVAVGDVNGDGLEDIYFTANQGKNRLFINKGDFQFEDVTDKAGVAGTRAWSTGVAMADVNGDGWLDIYVCNSGDIDGDNKQNELYINQKDGTFTEEAEAYGIADQGLSTHGVFFDYDRDGDLDLYLLNNSFRAIGSFNLKQNERPIRDSIGGDKLYRNDRIQADGTTGTGKFTDVSEAAGIYGSVIGFGLGITVGDIDRDGWQDIYISNDFFERDYIYMNNGDGTFREELTEQMRSISNASMGADMADLNNDGYPEIFVTEMLPEKDKDIKQKTTFEDWNKYQENLKQDYYHQFTRNTLQLNNGDGTFSEIGRLAGVEATDWSWGALIFDMDNDGKRDLFVANGIYQDLTDQDYIDFIANSATQRMIITREGVDFKTLVDSIPVRPIANYAFHQEGDLDFVNRAEEFGLSQLSHSNGSAYTDLDNDGDLDLVVNNVNMPAFIYRNESDKLHPDHHYLVFQLSGEKGNTSAVGTVVTLKYADQIQYLEHMPMRGFQSSVGYQMHFGLGPVAEVDSVIVDWIDGTRTVMTNVKTDQIIKLDQQKGAGQAPGDLVHEAYSGPSGIFRDLSKEMALDYRHKENLFSDFNRERLIYHMLSTPGPNVTIADVDGDGREDLFIGGAKDEPGKIMVQQSNGKFRATNETLLADQQSSEDTDCLFFDADGDGDQDLYVASGGNELPNSSSGLIDRLYINTGNGRFELSDQMLPTSHFESTSTVEAADYDGDGDQDLFVGIRLRPFLYGVPVNGYLLQNDGNGKFTDVTATAAPELSKLGMITDGIWTDFDIDGDIDLIVTGEWMPLTFFENDRGKLTKVDNATLGIGPSAGWWNCIRQGDLNGDGRPDFVLGNHGLNSRFRASAEEPLVMYVNDFDQNGSAEQIIARKEDGKYLPYVRRHELVAQMPVMKKKYLRYSSYVGQGVEDIFQPDQLAKAIRLTAEELASAVLLSQPNGAFALKPLPKMAQLSPVYGILVHDFDGDGHQDILLGGNLYNVKPEAGRYDANYGLYLRGDGQGNFASVPPKQSGFRTYGEVRDLELIHIQGKPYVLVARNNDTVQIFGLKNDEI
jgi:hypothetical protein